MLQRRSNSRRSPRYITRQCRRHHSITCASYNETETRVCDFLSPVGDDLMVALGNAQILLSLIGTALFWKARIVVTQFLF